MFDWCVNTAQYTQQQTHMNLCSCDLLPNKNSSSPSFYWYSSNSCLLLSYDPSSLIINMVNSLTNHGITMLLNTYSTCNSRTHILNSKH